MASTISDELKVTQGVKVGNTANPPLITGGSGAIDTTNRQNASLHLREDDNTLPEVMHNSAAEKLGFGQHAIECRVGTLTANTTNTFKTYAPRNMKVTGISRIYTAAPASSGGTVVASVEGDGNEMLASASEDEEGVTDDTLTAHSLTGTAANLLLDKGDFIQIDIVSDNADMTDGTNTIYYIYYEDN